MKRPGVAVLVSVVVALHSACTTTAIAPVGRISDERPGLRVDAAAATAPRMDAAPESGAAVKPAALDLRGWVDDWPKSWTDPRVVDQLAASCAFVPVRPPRPSNEPPSMGGDLPADPFECELGYSQSCVVDPCITDSQTCEGRCTGTCKGCGGTCTSGCEQCKGACKDDACKRACATRCAECKQTCTRTMDRCVSGDCSKVHASCTSQLLAMYRKNGCAGRCAGYRRCQNACSNAADVPACNDKCDTSMSATYRPCVDKCDGNAADSCRLACLHASGCSSLLCMLDLPVAASAGPSERPKPEP